MSSSERVSPAPELGDASNVLLLGPRTSETLDHACADALTADPAELTTVVAISIARPPTAWLDRFSQHTRLERLDQLGIIMVRDRSSQITGGKSKDARSGAIPDWARVEEVADPSDLTGLGIAITKLLSTWGEEDTNLTLCLDSLSTLFQSADRQLAFKFLHTLSGQVKQHGAAAHYHLDPETTEQVDVDLITSIMDAVVEVESDGGYTVSTR